MGISIKKLVLSALFLAAALVLPFLTGQIPQIGQMLCPMHIPVLLCGFICGAPYGLAVGFICPLLRSVLFGMPAMFPMAVSMAFELGAYGFFSGFWSRRFGGSDGGVYASLIISMIFGRVIWGIVRLLLAFIDVNPFTASMFVAGAFLEAAPGIVIQLVLVPMLLLTLRRAKLIPLDN